MVDKIDKWTNKIDFNSYSDFETHPCADISCPGCDKQLSISMKDLRKHQHLLFSNLKKEDHDLLNSLISDAAIPSSNSFLDYYCPHCETPTKILYDYWAGGKHGEYGYTLKYIAVNTTPKT